MIYELTIIMINLPSTDPMHLSEALMLADTTANIRVHNVHYKYKHGTIFDPKPHCILVTIVLHSCMEYIIIIYDI